MALGFAGENAETSSTVASGENALALGTGAQALAKNSISIGAGNKVLGEGSGAIGDPTDITGTGSYELGNDNGTYQKMLIQILRLMPRILGFLVIKTALYNFYATSEVDEASLHKA